MKDRVSKAKDEYEKKFFGKRDGAFYANDIYKVMDLCEGDAVKAIMIALEAGFMIGYRKGRSERAIQAAGGKV